MNIPVVKVTDLRFAFPALSMSLFSRILDSTTSK